MEYFKVISERENGLFSRKEIIAEMQNASSPKRTDIETIMSGKFSVAPDLVKVDIGRNGNCFAQIHPAMRLPVFKD